MKKRNIFNPVFFEKTPDGEFAYDVMSKLIKDRVIFLSEEITEDVGNQIAATLFLLDRQDDEEPIQIYINSCGGSVNALFSIYDLMQMIKAPVKTFCISEASSAAAIILAAGTKGERYALPNSHIMIHEMQMMGGANGGATDVENEAKFIKNLNRSLIETLARHTGQTYKKVLRDCKIDKYMSAQEAVDYGIVDHILPPNKLIPELIKAARAKPKKI